MSSYIVKFKNTSGEEGTIVPDVGFNYSDHLSSINEANIKISGSSEIRRSLIGIGSNVYIYRNGTLEFHGLVDSVDFLEGGGISVGANGYEVWLAKENGDYANSPWTATASATIFSAILAECSQPTGSAWSAGTIEAGTSIDFRLAETESLWNAISNLTGKTQQDIGIDYVNTEIDILDHKGSSTSVATFNAGIQISDIRVSQSYPLGNDVRVYGSSEGETRIKSNPATSGQDATSKSSYGTIRKIVRDPSISTQAEANILADALVAIYKDPVKVYDFNVINANQSVVSGDVITLNAKSQGISNEEVRIVGIEKGVRGGSEYLTLQVTNKEYSKLMKKKNEIIAEIEKNARDNQTYDQYSPEYSNLTQNSCLGGILGTCKDGTGEFCCTIFANANSTLCIPALQVGSHSPIYSSSAIISRNLNMCGCTISNATYTGPVVCTNCAVFATCAEIECYWGGNFFVCGGQACTYFKIPVGVNCY